MKIPEIIIEEDDAISFLNKDEDHFFDNVSKDYKGEAVQKKCVSFANADGGELLVGILDKNARNLSGNKFERWSGFLDVESANNVIIDILKNIKPSITNICLEFLSIGGYKEVGKILKVFIEKSPDLHQTESGNVYVRRGAQCLLITNPEEITNLKLSKGANSYENQSVDEYDLCRLYESQELNNFLKSYSPKTNTEDFLKKQLLIKKNEEMCWPIYAGVLLYDENPSAVLPKKCSVKIVRYDTSEEIPERDHLKQQETVEGPLYKQINESINIILGMIQSVPIMGSSGFVKAKYPHEAIREILVNAIIHRDYNISDDVSVYIFNNRIEIHSPGILPGHITKYNILEERFARNAKIVRLLNKYPDRPNKDIGEGLNTAFQKMREVRLKNPIIDPRENRVVVILPHEDLASPEEQIMEYLRVHSEINNTTAREITGIRSESLVKKSFEKLRKRGLIELIPEKRGSRSAWRKCDKNNFSQNQEIRNKQGNLFNAE